MTPLKKYKSEFWGRPCVIRPMLLDKIFGDGKERIWFQYLDDRPDYYVVRVPTGTHKMMDNKEEAFYDLLNEIEDVIADEAISFYTGRNWREVEKIGYVYMHRKWPIPPHCNSGYAWGVEI